MKKITMREIKKAQGQGIEPLQLAIQYCSDGDAISVIVSLPAFLAMGANATDIAEQLVIYGGEIDVIENIDIFKAAGVDLVRLVSVLSSCDTHEVIRHAELLQANGVDMDDIVQQLVEYGDIEIVRGHYGQLVELGADPVLLDALIE